MNFCNTSGITHFLVLDAQVFANTSAFGRSERNFVISEVYCVGTESELLECAHSSIGHHFCSLNEYDVAIICSGKCQSLSCLSALILLLGTTFVEVMTIISCNG